MEANLRLVVTVGRQTVKKGRSEINFQDACQEGIIGLSKACEKFDPEKGELFIHVLLTGCEYRFMTLNNGTH